MWLGEDYPTEAAPVTRALRANEDRVGIESQMVDDWLRHLATATPVYGGVLICGTSQRMGQPKHLLPVGGTTWIERTVATLRPHVDSVVLLGRGGVPDGLRGLQMLPDVTDREGPIAGMLAAMRWQPQMSWLFAACDLPLISDEAVRWLLSRRAPGVWATLPRLAEAWSHCWRTTTFARGGCSKNVAGHQRSRAGRGLARPHRRRRWRQRGGT